MNEKLSIIGKRVSVKKTIKKATGEAKFGEDLELPRMLHAKILRSPYAHAKILKINTRRAKEMSGVKAILTYKDVPQIPYGLYPSPYCPQDKYILRKKARYVGDPVAAVAAESEDLAEEALELIDVKYKELQAVFDPEEAMKPDAPQLHPELPELKQNTLIPPTTAEIGDTEKGFEEADLIFEDTFRTSIQCHCQLEPNSALVHWDTDGKLVAQVGTAAVFLTQKALARALGISIEKVRVVIPPGGFGGGYGGKYDPLGLGLGIAALLAKKADRPIKILFTREEQFCCSETRHSTIIKLKTGVRKDGTLTARRLKAIFDTGAYTHYSFSLIGVGIRSLSLYRCPNLRFEGHLVYTNNPVAGQMRGYGMPQYMHAVEIQNDEIAEELGIDPLDWRIKNHIRVGEKYWSHIRSTPQWKKGVKLASCGLTECIRRGAKRIRWTEKRKRYPKVRDGKEIGVGMAAMMHTTGYAPADCSSNAIIRIKKDGKVQLITGAADHGGTGLHTVLAQICAEELGVNIDDILVTPTDTESTLYDAGSFASGRAFIAGMAVMQASRNLKQHLFRQAAKVLRAPVQNLELRNSRVHVNKDPNRRVSFVKLTKTQDILEGKSLHYNPERNAPPFGAHFAEVEVDTETGQVKVLKFVAAHDIGRALNPMICEGQIEGSIPFGLGYALSEELIVDSKTGRTLNPNFADYKLFGARDMPEIEVILIESMEPIGPYGAKGVGDTATVPTAPAVVNAIYNAIGVRIKELPVTPDKILQALKEKDKEYIKKS